MRMTLTLGLAALLALAPSPTPGQEPPGLSCWVRGSLEGRPSPLDSLSISLEGGEALLCYGRPSARGRTMIGGEAVPFGTLWRMGANEATILHLGFPAEVAGVRLEPGSYSLYALPGADRWELFLSRAAERWGVPINDAVRAREVGHGTVAPEDTGAPVETLTFRWEGASPGSGELVVEWERTRIRIPLRSLDP